MSEVQYVAYYRVSTERQGKSGLGLEAQRMAVREFLKGTQGNLLGEFTEIESGRRRDRPQLAAALALCAQRRPSPVLVIAKLDRLARNVAFVSSLLESRVRHCVLLGPPLYAGWQGARDGAWALPRYFSCRSPPGGG